MINTEESIADVMDRVKKLEQGQVKIGSGTIVVADPNSNVSHIRTPDGGVLPNVSVVGNYIPEVGQPIHFFMNGTQPIVYPPTQAITSAPPAQVSGVSVLPGVGSLVIRWASLVEADVKWNRGYYQVQVDTANTFSTGNLKSIDCAGTSYTLTDLTPGTVYYVRVRGVDYVGSTSSGGWSATVSATAGAPIAGTISGQITTTQIADNSISTPKLQANAVTANEIAANTITAAQIGTNAITANELAALQLEVGKYIRSTSYVPGTSGWAIDANGSAEFNNVTARGVVQGAFVKGSYFEGIIGANIAFNPGAEVNILDWQFINCTGARTTTAGEFRSGSAGFKMTATGGGSPYMLTFQQSIEGGINWSANVFSKANSTARSIRVTIKIFDSSFAFLTSYVVAGTNATNMWKGIQCTSNGAVPTNAAYIQVEVMALSAAVGEIHFFDSITIFPSSTMATDIVTGPSGSPKVSIYSDAVPQIILYSGVDGEAVAQLYRTVGLSGQQIDITTFTMYSGNPSGGSAAFLQLDSSGVVSGTTRLFRANADRAYLNDGVQEIILGVHAATQWFQPAASSTSSTTPVEPAGNCRVTGFRKRHNQSNIVVLMSASCWSDQVNWMQWYVYDGTNLTNASTFFFNQTAVHMTQAGQTTIFGLAAGTYQFDLRWRVATGTQTIQMDSNDHISLCVMEVSA